MGVGSASRSEGLRFESRRGTVMDEEGGEGERGGERSGQGWFDMQEVRVWKDKLEKERGPNHMQEVKRKKQIGKQLGKTNRGNTKKTKPYHCHDKLDPQDCTLGIPHEKQV